MPNEHSNILLTDFGLCLFTEDDASRLTESDEAVGARLYIAPENESGINEDVDQRPADFYAFAKIMWALLAGRQPLAREQQREPGKRLADVREEQQFQALDRLADRLLNTDPRARLQDWELVIHELSEAMQILGGTPVEPREATLSALRESARKLANLPRLQEAMSAREREKDRDERFYELLQALPRGAQHINEQLADLTTMCDGAMEFSQCSGGPSLTQILGSHTERLPADFDLGAYTGPWGGYAVAWWALSRINLAWPRLYLGIYISLQQSGIWFARAPCLQPWDSPLMHSPRWLFDPCFCIRGPSSFDSAETDRIAGDLGAETATMFLENLAPKYVATLLDGGNPLEPWL